MSELASVTERRLANYAPIPEVGCWLFLGNWDNNGYGFIKSHGNLVAQAHRYFYSHLVGPIAEGMCVLHKCDTPSCVNPKHLFLGTHQENMNDKWRKGRARPGGKPAVRVKPYLLTKNAEKYGEQP